MEPPSWPLDQKFSGASEDFPALLRRKGLMGAPAMVDLATAQTINAVTNWKQPRRPQFSPSSLAAAFSWREIVARPPATPWSSIRADKVLEIDRHSIMAIAGVPATAWEMARVLEHSFQYFRRTQLQEMSVDGKVRALSKLLRDNFGFAMQGVGMVVPIFATYDTNSKPGARLYFYDAMGAQFEVTDYAATGSGSPAVRGICITKTTGGRDRSRNGARKKP